jgi:hypothetical protein
MNHCAVLRIRIRMDQHHFGKLDPTGSGFRSGSAAKCEKTNPDRQYCHCNTIQKEKKVELYKLFL